MRAIFTITAGNIGKTMTMEDMDMGVNSPKILKQMRGNGIAANR
jgi:hypothetical protein